MRAQGGELRLREEVAPHSPSAASTLAASDNVLTSAGLRATPAGLTVQSVAAASDSPQAGSAARSACSAENSGSGGSSSSAGLVSPP